MKTKRSIAGIACITLLAVIPSIATSPTGYNVGDKAADFKLKNVDGKMVSLADYKDAKGFIVIFTCNHCPTAQAYEDRMIQLVKDYSGKGVAIVAVSPNDPTAALFLPQTTQVSELPAEVKARGRHHGQQLRLAEPLYRRVTSTVASRDAAGPANPD